ncbi:MAG: GHKL domain-containing protein [Lachnospiraceae bacterium]|nr:GHKL domain-containing protein [Lachnospiraceae bacterium]
MRRWVMIGLIHGLLTVKFRYSGREKWVKLGFVILSTAYYLAVNYLPPLKRFFYGQEEGMLASRASIIPLFLSLLLMLVYCFSFYAGKKSSIFYLAFTAYTVNELILFTLHALFVVLMEIISTILTSIALNGNAFILNHFMQLLGVIEIFWNLSYQIVFLLLCCKVIQTLYKNLSCIGRKRNSIQELFLLVPSVMGFCFCTLIRSILYAYNGSQIKFVMDEYPETKLLIPIVSGLCLVSIILSSVILRKLVESSEKEMLVEVYQNRIGDMEEHMKDVEHLYDGIRGMRHDMKNHLADLEILLGQEKRASGEYEKEVRRYLDGLCEAMEELDMKCSSGNPVTDVVISRKMRSAAKKMITFESSFIFPEKLGISAFDVSILLNNGLDNAIEAAEKERDPFIYLDSYAKSNMFFIEIRNSFTGSLYPAEAGGMLPTSKEDSKIHGLGMKNMQSCAEKYFGTLRWESNGKEFLLEIMLQGKETKTNGKEWD